MESEKVDLDKNVDMIMFIILKMKILEWGLL